jgi:hypothetical protein
MKPAWIHVLRATLAVTAAAVLGACGDDRFIVIGSAKAPSTSGFVEIEDASDDGLSLLVHLEHLHPASRVDPAARHYVVWFQGTAGAPRYAGVLRYHADRRTGELLAAAPFTKLTVKITAETSEQPSAPSALEVASQAVDADN